ncbi:MAG TPA: hypothetical protein VIH55_05625 [Acidimicrobiia bacterium]
MSDTEYLAGIAFGAPVIAAVLALPVTWFLLRRYRKSIVRLMSRRGSPVESPAQVRSGQVPAPSADIGAGEIRAGLVRNAAIVVAIGILTGVAFALLLLLYNDIDLSVYRIAFFAVAYAWPTVVGVWIVSGADRRWGWVAFGVYFVLLWAAGLIGGLGPLDPLVQWSGSLIPTVALLAFLTRPLRGVGTLVLGTMMIGVVGSQAITIWVLGSDSRTLLWVELFSALGVEDVLLTSIGLQVGAFLVAIIAGVIVVRLLAGWYERQGFSDQMLLLGSTFLVFAVDASVTVDPSTFGAFWVGMAIYVVLGAGALLFYRWIHRERQVSPTLLMLRVFSPHRGTTRLLDRVSARWRYLGPVRMIGGPDLAVINVEPDEFLRFVSGGLGETFIETPVALERRVGTLRVRPDPDGRHRVDELFCFDDTWRVTVVALVERSDVVLMDVRGFGRDNQGCIDEIEMLAEEGALGRTVILVDDTTDHGLLEEVLKGAGTVPTTIGVSDEDADAVVAACLAATAGTPVTPESRFLGSD